MEALSPPPAAEPLFEAPLAARRRLAPEVFELEWPRPAGFRFAPGERVRLFLEGAARDYTLVSGPDSPGLRILVRRVAGGRLSPRLAALPVGAVVGFSGPHGHFRYRPGGPRPAVFVAAGVGIAPFCAMAAAGIRGYILLHGARREAELYYRETVAPPAAAYVPCLSGAGPPLGPAAFPGRVTGYLRERLAFGRYAFYLCGGREMVREAMAVVDERFADSLVYTEIFA